MTTYSKCVVASLSYLLVSFSSFVSSFSVGNVSKDSPLRNKFNTLILILKAFATFQYSIPNPIVDENKTILDVSLSKRYNRIMV
jgi:hypothetical protein